MMSELINIDTPSAVAVPQENYATLPMKKYVLAADLVLPSQDFIFGTAVPNFLLSVYQDCDPNGFMTEVEATNTSTDPDTTYTRIHLNHTGLYAVSARVTVFAHDPLIQNGTDKYDFLLQVEGVRSNGFRDVSVATDMLGDGVFPTGSSTQLFTGTAAVQNTNFSNNISLAFIPEVGLTVAGGPDYHRYTYLQVTFLGISEATAVNGNIPLADPYYTSQALPR